MFWSFYCKITNPGRMPYPMAPQRAQLHYNHHVVFCGCPIDGTLATG